MITLWYVVKKELVTGPDDNDPVEINVSNNTQVNLSLSDFVSVNTITIHNRGEVIINAENLVNDIEIIFTGKAPTIKNKDSNSEYSITLTQLD